MGQPSDLSFGEESQEKTNHSVTADLGGIFPVVVALHAIAVRSILEDILQPHSIVSCGDLEMP